MAGTLVSMSNKKRKTMLKDLNRKETGDVLDSFTEMERFEATLNQMTPEMFPTLLKQMEEMTIDTEEKMKGVVNLVFEKAISEPNCSFIYANMCLNRLKVSTCDTPGVTVSFQKLLLDLCQKEFNTDRYNEEIFKKRELELDAAIEEEVRTRLIKELDEAKDAARRRTLGNIKFIGELFKAKKLHEIIIHDCVVKLLVKNDEESLECLCILLSTVGKELEFEKSRKDQHSIFQMPFCGQQRMDEYFNLMKEIIEDRQTSSRICFKLQDLIDLRQNNWIPRQGDQIPKTIKQIHEVAELEEQREQMERLQATLNQMTPEMFPTLLKQMEEMTIDTEEKMKGVVNLVFEKAISEPNCSFIYANMCLNRLKVSTCDTPGVTVSFQKLLLDLCQKEFNTDRYNEEIFKKRELELDAAIEEEVRTRLIKELDEAKDAARRRTLGNIKFIGELFKAKKLHEIIIHDCVVKQLKNHDEESLECLCILLSTVGKELDFEKSRPRMDVYFNLMKKIIEDRQTSSRICFKLQDLIDLRQNNWIPRQGDQIPKTIKQIHEVAELEEQREQINTAVELKERKKERRK